MLDTPSNTDFSGGALSQCELSGILAWWREAGVDCSFADDAEGWLELPEEPAEQAPPPPKVEAPRPTTPPGPSAHLDTPSDTALVTVDGASFFKYILL